MTTRRLVLAGFAILGLCLAYQMWQRAQYERQAFEQWVTRQRAELDAAGWERAESRSQNQLAAVVMALTKDLDAAREAGARIAMTSRWQGKGEAVWIPCDTTGATPGLQPGEPGEAGRTGESAADTPADRATAASPTPPGAWPVQHVKIEDAVVVDDAGAIYVKRAVQGQLTVGETFATPWVKIVPVPGKKTYVDPKLEEALRLAQNPPPKVALLRKPSQWRLGGTCGAGGGYSVIEQRGDVGVYCVYGVQF